MEIRTRKRPSRDRGNGKYSVQPRFTGEEDADGIFMATYQWVENAYKTEPDYKAVSATRDEWLRKFIRMEPNLQGVMKSVVDIDKNRGWRMIGGRNQVLRYTDVMHGFQCAPDLYGWRPSLASLSQSFWGTDLGALTELGRDGEGGPLRALYTVDPVTCTLTGDIDKPLKYKLKGKNQYWSIEDYIRVASLPYTDEKFHGLGFCAVSRCLELAKLMIAVYEYDKEALSARAPRGFMLLQGISQNNWRTAMKARDAELDAEGYDYFDNIAVLASNAKVDAKLFALSQLPTSFNLREWMDMLLFGYAVCWGYDASEFWPVQFGALGRGTETEIQHEKATAKGRLDFVLGFQEQLQWALPATLDFEFDQRDEQGDLIHASVNQAWVNVVKSMYESNGVEGQSLVSHDEARVLLSRYGVIPSSWAPDDLTQITDEDSGEEEAPVEDVEDIDAPSTPDADEVVPQQVTVRLRQARDELRTHPKVMRAAMRFPDEPIVQYSYPSNTMFVMWERGDDVFKKQIFQGASL